LKRIISLFILLIFLPLSLFPNVRGMIPIDGTYDWTVTGNLSVSTINARESLQVGGVALDSTASGNAGTTLIGVQALGTPSITNLHEALGVYNSSGLIEGGNISDSGSEQIDIASLKGALRNIDDHLGELFMFDMASSTNITIPTDTIRYIGVEWNNASPQFVLKTSDDWNTHNEFNLGSVVNESGTLHILNNPEYITNFGMHTIHRFYETFPFKRADRLGGLIIGETGTRYVTLSAGELYDRVTEFEISAIDTSVSGTFDSYTSGGLESTGNTQWDNDNYDNGGVLTTLNANRYANLWWYIEADGDLVCVYGTAQHFTFGQAELETVPTVLPDRLVTHGTLVGRYIFQKSAATTEEIQTAFNNNFALGAANNHANLANLNWASAGHTIDTDIDLNSNSITNGATADFINGSFSGTVTANKLTDGTAILNSGSITDAVNGTFSGTLLAPKISTKSDNSISDTYGLAVGASHSIASGAEASVCIGDNHSIGGLADYSFATGEDCSITARYAISSGWETHADTWGVLGLGRLNAASGGSLSTWSATDPILVVGDGIGEGGNRHNAFTILKNGNTAITTWQGYNAWLKINSETGTNASIYFGDTADDDIGYIDYDNNTDTMSFGVNTNEIFDLTTALGLSVKDGYILNVGTPSSTVDANFFIRAGNAQNSILNFGDNADSNVGYINYDHNDNSMIIGTNTATAIAIDSSEHVILGTTPNALSNERKLNIYGTNQSTAGPHMNFYTNSDLSNPYFQILVWQQDNSNLLFDNWYDGTNFISSDPGSNFQIRKTGNDLDFKASSGTAVGSPISSFLTAMVIEADGRVRADTNGFGVVTTTTVSYTNMTIQGRVNASGTKLTGDGFTVSKVTTGEYAITYSTSFNGQVPSVQVTGWDTSKSGSSSNNWFSVYSETTSGCRVLSRDTGASYQDSEFAIFVSGRQ
jgi:hypothetical protein